MMEYHLNWARACYGEKNYHLRIYIYMHNDNFDGFGKIDQYSLIDDMLFFVDFERF